MDQSNQDLYEELIPSVVRGMQAIGRWLKCFSPSTIHYTNVSNIIINTDITDKLLSNKAFQHQYI